MTKKKVSKCCKAEVKVAGHTTHFHICLRCGRPCNVMFVPQKEKPEDWEKTDDFIKSVKIFQEWFNQEGITSDNVWNLDMVIGRFAVRFQDQIRLAEKRGYEKGQNDLIGWMRKPGGEWKRASLLEIVGQIKQQARDEVLGEIRKKRIKTGRFPLFQYKNGQIRKVETAPKKDKH